MKIQAKMRQFLIIRENFEMEKQILIKFKVFHRDIGNAGTV